MPFYCLINNPFLALAGDLDINLAANMADTITADPLAA